jgi:hypothetical protein
MPTASTALRQVSFYTYCVDEDLRKMFLNFPMDPDLRPCAGVDLRAVQEAIKALNDVKGALCFGKTGNVGSDCSWVSDQVLTWPYSTCIWVWSLNCG